MVTALEDIKEGRLRTGLLQQFMEIPTPEKENLKQLNMFIARRMIRKEWGESRPTDKDLSLALKVMEGVALTEEQNKRLLELGLDRSRYMMEDYEARGRALRDFEARNQEFYPQVEPVDVPRVFEGYVNPDTGKDYDMTEEEFRQQYGQ